MGDGLERLGEDDLRVVRAQARRIHRRALAATLIYTVGALLLP